ncbi:MAG: hypothetical protein HQL03_00920 [Nitrospirae bacterium]|nr:hypothetical protein [Nitrospirota bacterium]MBF0593234.1 hypothetical protein [Nitrospirota bacterium]
MDVSATGIQQSLYPQYGLSGSARASGNGANNKAVDGVNGSGSVNGSAGNNTAGVTWGSAKTTSNGSVDQAKDRALQVQVQRLKQREQDVRAHEQAHESVGGQYAGAPTYQYTTGPDGKRYINGGEVPIDISTEKDPQATINKMRQVRAAALAPVDPSPQDQAIASKATSIENSAQQELNAKRFDQSQKQKDTYLMVQGVNNSGAKQDVGSNVSIYV